MSRELLTVLLIGTLAAACSSGGGGTGTVVTSDDGKATVTIPDGALPEGISASDIQLTAAPSDALQIIDFGEGAEGSVLAGYRLDPEGTRFTSPVAIRIEIGQPLSSPALGALHGFAEGFDFLSPELELNEAGDSVVAATVELSHFSSLALFGTDRFFQEVAVQPVDTSLDTSNIPVGSSFELIGGVKVDRGSARMKVHIPIDHPFAWGFVPDDDEVGYGTNKDYDATLEWAAASPNLSPPIDPENDTSRLSGQTAEVSSITRTFTCESAGDFAVVFEGTVSAEFALIEDGSVETFSATATDSWRGRCVGTDGGGESCDHAHECGAGRLCGDGKCKLDSGSKECAGDADCGGTRPVCETTTFQKQAGTMRCADCRDNSQCSGVRDICVNNHCVDCGVDGDCPSGICTPAKTCGECREASDCSDFPGSPMCVEGFCRQCGSDAECTGALPRCGGDGLCVQCTSDADCGPPLDRCRMGRCNSCANDNDCPSLALSSCNFSGCSTCDGDFDCDGDYTCENAGFRNACTIDCNGDGDCAPGQKCISGRCAQCNTDSDCPASAPICGPDGHCFECTVERPCNDGRVCRVSTGNCVHCINDSQCTNPGLPICAFNACTGCSVDDDCNDVDPSYVCKPDGSCAPP